MKIFTFATLVAMFGFFANAAAAETRNYMGEAGTTWEYLLWSDAFPPEETEGTFTKISLLDAGEFLGKQTFGLGNYETGDIWEKWRIYTEGEKVYFYDTEKKSGWKLFFDFGLKVGEATTVGNSHTDDTFYVVCTDRKEDTLNPGFAIMSMDVYTDKEAYEAGENPGGPTYWVTGIGNLGEPFDPVSSIMLGGGCTLLRVTQGDKVIYTSEYGADVEEIAETEPRVTIGHGEIDVDGASSSMLYDLNGRSYSAADGRFSNLAKGVYILRCGDNTRKIFVP